MSGFSAFVLNMTKSGNILLKSIPHGNCLFSSASLSLVGDNSLVHDLVMTAFELLVNAAYYSQHSALKSVNRKNQSVIVGKFFSSYRTVFDFELAHGLQDSKTSGLNPSISLEVIAQKEAFAIRQDMVFASVLYVLYLSVLGRFIYLFCDTGSLR